MKKLLRNKYVILVMVLIAGGLIGWLVKPSMNQTIKSEDQTINESNHRASENLVFTCSMHPQIRRSEPGSCPICGMDLILLETSDSNLDPLAVSMSPTAIQLAQVQTLVVGKGNSGKSIRLNGKVQEDERLLFTQSSHIPGRIEKLAVNFTGEFISEGQVIAYVFSPELVNAQEELFEARKIKDTHPALFNASREKLKNWKLSDNQIEQILSSDKTIDQFPVLANVSGYVTKKMVNPGDYIKQGQAIYNIADLSKVWVLFDVYESDMSWVKKGASVNYTVQSIPGKTFTGTISYIDPVINPNTRVAKARIETNNSDLELKPEMLVSGTVAANLKISNTSLTVPKTAVMWTGKRSLVYVMQNSKQGLSFRMREVTLGPELEDSYVIESGLEPGEEIAVNGTFSIDAAAQLAGKPSMMNKTDDLIKRSDKVPMDIEFQKELNQLFTDYFEMKNALVEDDFKKAITAATRFRFNLNKAIGTSINQNISKSDHQLWMRQSTSLKENLEHIEHWSDIKAIRESFIGISNTVIAVAESFDPFSITAYIQYCPMANSNKGAHWLSENKEIRNPYFGEAMLTCGETTKTFN